MTSVTAPPTELLRRGLLGEACPPTVRGAALWHCRSLRATRAWLRPGSYGWWRYTDDLKAAQRYLLTVRITGAPNRAALS